MSDIIIEHLNKAYNGKPVLGDVNLRFPAGGVTCLMAPSGAGKTTLLRIMMGLEHPDSGRVIGLDGARLGVVFQEDRLLDALTALDNLCLVRLSVPPETLPEALADFGLHEAAGKPARELSGGMRRRVALLRALVSDGEVLILDEPFTGLDAETRAHVIDETRRRIAGRTTVLVSHDPEDARLIGAQIARL